MQGPSAQQQQQLQQQQLPQPQEQPAAPMQQRLDAADQILGVFHSLLPGMAEHMTDSTKRGVPSDDDLPPEQPLRQQSSSAQRDQSPAKKPRSASRRDALGGRRRQDHPGTHGSSSSRTNNHSNNLESLCLTMAKVVHPERTNVMVNYVACSLDQELYLNITSELLNLFLNDPQLVPRSSYRKAIGEGIRTITYGAHTSLAAVQKSHKFVTNITTADNHQSTLLLCHKLAALMPKSIPYLCITVVVLTTGEDLAPHRDIQNHRHFRNATISLGKWEGGVLQTYEDDIWVNQDSRDQWVILDARNTFHRVTSVEGDRVSIICYTPQHLDRLRQDDWDILRDAGFPPISYGKAVY